MSDTLREALKAFIEASDGDGARLYVYELRTILAAHPDNTSTEWGIQTDSGIEGPYSETVARMYARESDTQGWDEPGELVSRQVTEWSEAK